MGGVSVLALGGVFARPVLGLEPVELNQQATAANGDIVLDWRVTYNGDVLSDTDFETVGGTTPGPVIQLGNVTPGDDGALTVRISVPEGEESDTPLELFVGSEILETAENNVTEPEEAAGDTTHATGELQDAVEAVAWYDVGAGGVDAVGACNGGREPGEPLLAEGSLAEVLTELAGPTPINPDSDPEPPCFDPGDSICLSIAWWLPDDVGNVVQTDSVVFDLRFLAEQCGMSAADAALAGGRY